MKQDEDDEEEEEEGEDSEGSSRHPIVAKLAAPTEHNRSSSEHHRPWRPPWQLQRPLPRPPGH